LAYSLYKGPYSNFNPYSQSRDTSRDDAIRRLLSFSSNQPSVSGSSFNDMVNADLQNQYESIYGDNVPQNTTLKIPQISDNPNYPALDLYSPEMPAREELPKLPSQFKGGMLLNYKSPSIPVPRNRSYLDAIKDWSDRASMAAGEIITGIDRPYKPKIGDFEVISRGFMSDKDKLPGNIKINLPESFTSDRPVNLNSADLAGGLAGFLAGGEFNVGSKVFQGAENAIGQALAKLGAKSSKVANIPNITQSAIKVGGATVPYEYSRSIANDREFDTGEATRAGATNAALGVILGRLGSALGRDRTPAPAPNEFRMPEYRAPDMSGFTPDELANFSWKSSPREMITPDTVVTKELAAAQRTLKSTLSVEKANQILDEFPELEREFPHFRLQQGDTVILPNGKEAIVKTADKMIIQVDVDGKTASIGRKVIKVPEVKAEVPEVVSEAIPEVSEIATPEIEQQPAGEPVRLTAEQQQSVDKLVKDYGFNSIEDAQKAITSYRNMVNEGQVFYRGEMVPDGAKGKKNNIIRQKNIEDILDWTPDNLIKKHEANIARQEITKKKAQEIFDTADPIKDYSKRDNAKGEIDNSDYWISNYQKEIDKLRKQIKNDEEISKIAEENNLLYVTSQKENALSYAKQLEGKSEILFGEKPEDYNPTVYELKGKFDNTFDLTKYKNGLISIDEVENLLNDLGIKLNDKQFNELINKLGIDEMEQNSGQVFGLFRGKNLPIMLNALKKGNYDSVHYEEGLQDNWIVLDRKKVAIKDDLEKASKLDSATQDRILGFESDQGKPVPPKVLKDYPELSAEVGSKPTLETKTMAEDIGLKPEKAETYDEGTIGAARLTVPEKQSTLPGTDEKVRSFQRTAIDAPVTDDMTKAGLLVDIYAEGPGAYKPITNIETEAAARKFIEDNGIDVAVNRVMDKTETSAEQVALAGQLTYALQKQGKHEQALNMIESLAEQLTSAGQKIQAVKIFQNLSPEGVLIKANKETKKAFNELPKQTKDKHGDLSGKLQDEFNGIDKEVINQVVNETPELGGNKPKPKQCKPNTEKQTDPANMLAQRIVSYTKPMMPASIITHEMQMVKTLFSKAKEVLPIEKAKLPKKNALDEVVTALQQSDNYRKTWDDAKQSIIEQNGELPQVMKDVEAYIEHYLNVPYSERSLGNILVEAMKDKNFNLEQSAFGPMSPNFRGTKAENTAFIQSIVKDSGLTGRDAEVLSLELGSKLDEALTKKRNDKTSDLAKRIIKMATENPKDVETNPVKEMFNILMQKAKESMPKVEGAKSTKDGMLPIYNALNNRKMFNQVWSEAKKDIVKRLEAKGLSVEGVNLDQMFAELLYHPYTKGQLGREVNKGIKQYGIDVNNIVRQHFTVAEKTGQDLAEKLTTRGMLSKDEAALLAQDIQARFAEVAETKKQQILKNMFREKSLTKEQKTIDQKIVELSNLGALSKEQYRRSVAEKMGLPSLSKEVSDQLVAIAEKIQTSTGNAKELAVWELHAAFAALQKPNVWQKLSSGQVIAQLGNIKTHLRNIIGNEGFYRADRFVKYPASLIDSTISKLTGTPRTVTWRTSGGNMINNYLDGFVKEFKDIGVGAKRGAKAGWVGTRPENLNTQFDLRPKAFSDKGNIAERTVSFLENLNSAALTAEDFAAFNRARNETLREIAIVRAINKTGKTEKAVVESEMKEIENNISDVAHEVSRKYGEYATYQDDNFLSTTLLSIKRKLNKLSTLGATEDFGFGDLVMKYVRTPGALILRGMEYSPLGILKSAKELYMPWRKTGTPDRREAILALSRAIVGTAGLSGMGWFLADVGILTGSMDPEKDVRAMQKKVIGGSYRVNLSALKRFITSGFDRKEAEARKDDTLMDYSWYQPLAMAISFGANMSNNGFGKAIKGQPDNYLEGIVGAINSIAEQPLFSGIQQLATKYPGETAGEQAARGIGTVVKGAVASFVPTLFNQARTTIDNSERITYDTSFIKEMVNKVITKIPGLSETLPKSYDTLGEEKEIYKNGTNNPFYTFVSPAFINKYNPSKEAMLAISTFQETGETDQFPREVRRYFTVSEKRFDLTPDEWSQMQKTVGEKTQQGFSKISPKMRPEIQVKKMVDILGKAGEYGKIQILKQRNVKFRKTGNGLRLLGVEK